MYIRTDDPLADFSKYDDEMQKRLDRLPLCYECGNHIQQERAVRIGAKWYCDECLDDMREDTDNEGWSY